jgi:hypothetical protein
MPRGLRRMLEALGVLSELKVKSGKLKGLTVLGSQCEKAAQGNLNRNPKGRFAEAQGNKGENRNTEGRRERRHTESRKSVLSLYLYHTDVVKSPSSNVRETKGKRRGDFSAWEGREG